MISEKLHNTLRRLLVHSNALSTAIGHAGWHLFCLCNNYNFNMNTNGEKALMQALTPHEMKNVFDVGAYKGHWSVLALSVMAPEVIHAFEPVPDSFARLKRYTAKLKGIKIHQTACGEKRDSIEMAFNAARPTRSSFHDRSAKYDGLETIEVRITDGTSFCARHEVERIDFLKIDAEGHESRVIAGFEPMLASQKIRVVQFEYAPLGTIYDVPLWTLYEAFEKHGFIVGKIFPDGVAFAPFKSLKETILGPNYCAVMACEHGIIDSVHAKHRTDFDYVRACGGPRLKT